MSKLLSEYAETQLMCEYCENLVPENQGYCIPCNEYKSVMTIAQFQKIYGEEY